ncbi:MAG TPA: hypothetical protein VFB43_06650 [Terracidiphilus sp.]|nr:hypothetical protein [Terracidiphilus sp.]
MTYTTSLLILNQDKKVLAVRQDAHLALPEVNVEQGRVGISVSRAVQEQLNLKIFFLVLSEAEAEGYPVLRLQSPDTPMPRGYVWADSAELPLTERLQKVIEHVDLQSEAVGSFEWYERVEAWLKVRLIPLGYSVRALEQWNGRVGGVLLRIVTDGPVFWFKAVSDFNVREMAIAELLSERSPAHFPRILAREPGWNGFLLEHIEGRELYECDDLETWEQAAKLLADVQMDWTGRGDSLLRAGAADLRAGAMNARMPAFLDHIEEAMGRQPKTPPERLTRVDLDELGIALKALCADVAAFEFAEGLANADFSPHNTLITATGPVFIDWAEACVSLPLIAGEYLWNRMVVESPQRVHWQAPIRAAYLSRWKERYGSRQIEQAAQRLPAFSLLAVAMFYHERESHGPSPYDSYLRSLARKLHQAVARIYGERYALQA